MAQRILIADDAQFMRQTLKQILESNGYDVVGEASDGVQSVALYQELHPDIVAMDLTMPEMGGIDALRAIRAADPSANVVMCTSLGQKAMVIEAMQAGAKDFIEKPFRPERVVDALRKLAA